MAHKDKDTKKWSAQWFERTAKNEIFNLADEQGIIEADTGKCKERIRCPGKEDK